MGPVIQEPLPDWLPRSIVSGGQTGVDRAALDWALRHRIPHGGWCPKGRRAVDGIIPAIYRLQETDTVAYARRTRLNVRDSDATLIFNIGELTQGTLLTLRCAEKLGRPHRVVTLEDTDSRDILDWLAIGRFATLNIAGPREENRPGIYARTLALLEDVWRCGGPDTGEGLMTGTLDASSIRYPEITELPIQGDRTLTAQRSRRRGP